jgi:hypothetical protein
MNYSNLHLKETPFWKKSQFWLFLLILGFLICGAFLSELPQFPIGQNPPPGLP